jgi:hypothetical protein
MASVLGASALWCGAPVGRFTGGVQSVGAKPSIHVGNVGVRRLESTSWRRSERGVQRRSGATGWGGSNEVVEPLDLTEANVEQVLLDARSEVSAIPLASLFSGFVFRKMHFFFYLKP